jgi:hypothetical protein
MPFQQSIVRPYSDLDTVGIAILWDAAHDQVHMGVLHRLDDDVQLCHLKFHHLLRREPPDDGYFWTDCAMFSGSIERSSNGRVFAVLISETARNPNIPYGFAFDESCFDNDGTYRPMEIGKGLTCASFVIALFHSHGYPILKLKSWKVRPEDIVWQERILNPLRRYATSEHVNAASAYVGQFRYRPEEVAAGAVVAPPPLDFDESVSLATDILATIGATPIA